MQQQAAARRAEAEARDAADDALLLEAADLARAMRSEGLEARGEAVERAAGAWEGGRRRRRTSAIAA